MSRRFKPTQISANTKLWFGVHKGKTPTEMFKSGNVENLRYLLWMRDDRDADKRLKNFSLSYDLLLALDQAIRSNAHVFVEYKETYSIVEYEARKAEKRLQKQRQLEEKAQQAKDLEERQRLDAIKIKTRQAEYLAKKKLEADREQEFNEVRCSSYHSTWGNWS